MKSILKKLLKALKYIVLVFILFIAVMASIGLYQNKPWISTEDTVRACIEEDVKSKLIAPADAVFSPTLMEDIKPLEGSDENYSGTSFVDAPNKMGVMIRSKFTCVIFTEGREAGECAGDCTMLSDLLETFEDDLEKAKFN